VKLKTRNKRKPETNQTMESKLSLPEFRARLRDNTEIGSPKLKLSPFGLFAGFGGSNPFYGLFDDQSFRLTLNSSVNPTFFIIKGKYKITNEKLLINYDIEPSTKFYLAWVKFFPISVLILVNLLFVSSKNINIEAVFVFNIVLIFFIFYSRWNLKYKRKNIEQKFIEIFEIIK